MSRLRLGKKLQPAKRAWKSFSTTLQSRANKLNIIPKAIKSTFKHLIATLTSRTTPHAAANNHYVHRHSKKNISAIQIDDLFDEPASSSSMLVDANNKGHHARGETSRGKEEVVAMEEKKEEEEEEGGSSGIETIEDAWKIVVAKSPHQLQVDEKAEEFISKIRQDMRIQKEMSLLGLQNRKG